jgi:2-polyprenyl-3-methyl-5-hydroxy-6-metoxy-1,4-benzoquinol methylase
MTISQTDYYQSRNLHPDSLSGAGGDALKKHFAIRENLYRNLLNIPLGLLDGAEVLEVGCGTGESALFLAEKGANLTLIDPDPTVITLVKRNFSHQGLRGRIRGLLTAGIEDFEADDKTFHLVTAEGFLFTLAERDAALRKICTLIRPGGLGILSFPERFGSFFEFLKKAALWRAYQLAGISDVHGAQALALAEDLLGPAHAGLPNPRPFAVWWEDCMVSPFLTWDHCWDYGEILGVISGARCRYHASSPRMHEADARAWYKETQTPEELNQRILSCCRERRFDLLFGCRAGLEDGTEEAATVENTFKKILISWSEWFGGLDHTMPQMGLGPAKAALEKSAVPTDIIADLDRFFTVLGAATANDLVHAYHGLTAVGAAWGHSLQFLCFTKDAFPGGSS